ncbi:MAG: hypothetical protein Q8N57_02270, partial [bacterium]|nr:hypothetical protein [bacterium]
MTEYKIILGALASIITFLAYLPYFRDIFRNKTKPHIFSWFIWGLLGTIAFFAQIIKGAGAGSWGTAVSAMICFIIVGLAFSRGEKNITLFDWLAFSGALVGLVLWKLT